MSLGYCGYANLQEADDTLVIYSYCCYNINNEGWERFENASDGELYIDRDAFVEPEIHEKPKKAPSGRNKLVVKRVKRDFPFREYLDKEKIKVKNASGTWKTNSSGIDMIALQILLKMFDEYQEIGKVPEHIGLFY